MRNLSNQKFFREDFSGQDLKGLLMSHSEFICCNFQGADISGNDCTGSKFSGSDLTGIYCNGTNFKDAQLGCRFYPADAYGITVTLNCATFRGILISKLWWYCWLFFGMSMVPEKDNGEDPRDSVIAALGHKRYLALKKIFQDRVL